MIKIKKEGDNTSIIVFEGKGIITHHLSNEQYQELVKEIQIDELKKEWNKPLVPINIAMASIPVKDYLFDNQRRQVWIDEYKRSLQFGGTYEIASTNADSILGVFDQKFKAKSNE
jgi:hypothetical protein